MPVKRGQGVGIVTEEAPSKGGTHIRNSIIYDLKGSTIVLAQTDPPLLKSMAQKEIVVTYLVQEEKGPVRYGFSAKVTGFVDDYMLSSKEKVGVVCVSPRGKSEPYSIRTFYRVEPTSRSGVTMTVDGKDVNILDLSLGGVKFSYDKRLALVHLEAVHVVLTIDGKSLDLDSRILRLWGGGDGLFKSGLMFASAEFQKMSLAVEHDISRKMREIEMETQRI